MCTTGHTTPDHCSLAKLHCSFFSFKNDFDALMVGNYTSTPTTGIPPSLPLSKEEETEEKRSDCTWSKYLNCVAFLDLLDQRLAYQNVHLFDSCTPLWEKQLVIEGGVQEDIFPKDSAETLASLRHMPAMRVNAISPS